MRNRVAGYMDELEQFERRQYSGQAVKKTIKIGWGVIRFFAMLGFWFAIVSLLVFGYVAGKLAGALI